MNGLLKTALDYASKGKKVFPVHSLPNGNCSCGNRDCDSPGKHPRTAHGFQDATTDLNQIKTWWAHCPDANIGMPTGRESGVVVLDVDPRNGGAESFYQLQEKYGKIPVTTSQKTGGQGSHFIFEYPKGKSVSNATNLGGFSGIDIKADGGYILLPPSKTKTDYSWVDPTAKPAPLPPWLLELIVKKPGGRAEPLPDTIKAGDRNNILTSLAGSMRNRGSSAEAIFAALKVENERCVDTSGKAALLDETELRKIAQSIGQYPVGDPSSSSEGPGGGRTAVTSKTRSDTQKLLRQGFHDAGNAERLEAVHGRDLRYCYEFRKWLIFDGRRWVPDTQGVAEKWAKETIVSFLRQAVATKNESAEKFARGSLNVGRINGMLALAQCELPIVSIDLDTHPYLLNCLNGTLDLKTGKLQEHRREDYLTKLVHFEYKPQAECPRFKEFLYEIMGSTSDSSEADLVQVDQLVEYLQKAFGYACTGDTSEKKVFCFFGGGDNGKTTLLEAVRHVLAEYSHQVLISSLMARTIQETNASLADLADLRGARFITTSEGERGQRLAEAKLKYLTAGMGEIKTCRKYENPIKFPATHKLFIDSNYKPRVHGTDDAIWARLRPIPFTVTIPPERIDKSLLTKLKGEGEGILAWLIEGCQKWQREGLPDPQQINDSAAGWQNENNPLRDFIADTCILDLDRNNGEDPLFCGSATLSQAYRQWAQDNGEKYSLSPREFGNRLELAVAGGKNESMVRSNGFGLGLD